MFAVLATIYSCLTLPIYLHTFLWLTLIQSKQARKQIQIDYRLLLFQWKYTKTPMSKFECFGHAVKGQSYFHVLSRVPQVVLNFLHLQKLTAGQSIIWSTSFLKDEQHYHNTTTVCNTAIHFKSNKNPGNPSPHNTHSTTTTSFFNFTKRRCVHIYTII